MYLGLNYLFETKQMCIIPDQEAASGAEFLIFCRQILADSPKKLTKNGTQLYWLRIHGVYDLEIYIYNKFPLIVRAHVSGGYYCWSLWNSQK